MAHDEVLAERIRAVIGDRDGLTEKRMFGGLAFLVDGNMAVAASGEGGLMVRLDPGDAVQAVTEPGATQLEMRGRPMRGWLRVDTSALDDDAVLASWVKRGVTFAGGLPPK